MRFAWISPLFILLLLSALSVLGQSPNGNINGLVLDPTNRLIVGADVIAVNDVTGVQYTTQTNDAGVYVLPNLPPGPYRLQVSKVGFKTIIKPDITLSVQDALSINFTLPVGATMETVTIQSGVPLVNTESAAVSTVVDRQFAENLPMNGRSFQTLIALTPGVVLTPVNLFDGGQFSVDGQRSTSNYWTVDGVSANFGIGATSVPGNGLAGALGSFSALGGTNSLVSIDAMQEFRIQTSTYAPEFGRTPGAQISIATRSGTNRFHGTVFDYLRNDVFDANDWFADYAALAKPKERQNDFGGTFSGPIAKDRTFFFFSYEGLRLRLPRVALDTVPDQQARQSAVAAMQPYLNAFPFDPNQPDLGNGKAQYNVSYSNAGTLDAYSLRLDHRLSDRWGLFGRYNYSPSEVANRGDGAPLSVIAPTRVRTQTLTLGAVWTPTASLTNDFRFNYSRTRSTSTNYVDGFGGSTPLASLPFPAPFTARDSFLAVGLFDLKGGNILTVGRTQQSLQRQLNWVDSIALQRGTHSLKFGIDYRRLAPEDDPRLYWQVAAFLNLASAEQGTPFFTRIISNVASSFLFQNLGAFAQDTWKVNPRLTLTYGLRWDVDFAPSSERGPNLLAVTGYDLRDLSQLALSPAGTAPFHTRFGNIAPRVGLAYSPFPASKWPTILRGGFGVFYDLATSEFGTLVAGGNYPFSASKLTLGGSFPLDSASAAPPPIVAGNLACCGNALTAFDPNLQLPRVLQWNAALEQGLGDEQSLTMSYVGSSGQRLLQTTYIYNPNPDFAAAELVGNTATSSYHALQLRYQRRLTDGLQALASYSWSHSIDNASAGSNFFGSNTYVPSLGAQANRGPSDFDVRHAFSVGFTYDIPGPRGNPLAKSLLRDWSLQSFALASSATPVDIYYSLLGQGALLNAQTNVRPDLIPGQPIYLYGADCIAVLGPPCAGGKGFNPAAFAPPPLDSSTQQPLRQGNLGRNALRGFGVVQWDFAVHREFPIREPLKLQFRAELFNILNHPNFGQPSGNLGSPASISPQFGQSQAMLGQSLGGAQYSGNAGGGGLSPLYQIGGPRSMQFALKLIF
jgi:outer membrane receptor protein involved in Fe transport